MCITIAPPHFHPLWCGTHSASASVFLLVDAMSSSYNYTRILYTNYVYIYDSFLQSLQKPSMSSRSLRRRSLRRHSTKSAHSRSAPHKTFATHPHMRIHIEIHTRIYIHIYTHTTHIHNTHKHTYIYILSRSGRRDAKIFDAALPNVATTTTTYLWDDDDDDVVRFGKPSWVVAVPLHETITPPIHRAWIFYSIYILLWMFYYICIYSIYIYMFMIVCVVSKNRLCISPEAGEDVWLL